MNIDDAWHPDNLARQLKAAMEWDADILFCSMNLFKADGRTTGTIPKQSFRPGLCSYERLLKKSYASTQTIMGRRDCFIAEPFDEALPRMQDWDIVLRLARKFNVYYQNEILVDTHLQQDSLTMQTAKGLVAYRSIYSKHKIAIENNPKIKAAHIALEGYLLTLSRKNAAGFYWRNLSARYGFLYNAKFVLKALLSTFRFLSKSHAA